MDTERHGGNLWSIARKLKQPVEGLTDFSASINPLGPPHWFAGVMAESLPHLVHYPDPDSTEFTEAVATHTSAHPEEIAAGNGSSELLFCAVRVLGKERALVPAPCYVDYPRAATAAGLQVEMLPLNEETDFIPDTDEIASKLHGNEIVILGTPGNPSGATADATALRRLAAVSPNTFFIIDEAFIDFPDNPDSLVVERPGNVLVLRSLTKFYAIPGLRLGYAVGDREIIRTLKSMLIPWSVNTFAQRAGPLLLRDHEYAEKTRILISSERTMMTAALGKLPYIKVYRGMANYLLVRTEQPGLNARHLYDLLLERGMVIRVCGNIPALDDRYFRVAVRLPEENNRLIAALKEILG